MTLEKLENRLLPITTVTSLEISIMINTYVWWCCLALFKGGKATKRNNNNWVSLSIQRRFFQSKKHLFCKIYYSRTTISIKLNKVTVLLSQIVGVLALANSSSVMAMDMLRTTQTEELLILLKKQVTMKAKLMMINPMLTKENSIRNLSIQQEVDDVQWLRHNIFHTWFYLA